MRILVRPAAASDIERAHAWYMAQRPQLASEFLDELQAAVDRVLERPLSFPVLHRDTRRVRLRRFPYGLFYRVLGDLIVVIACMHGRRSPRAWRSR